MSDLPPPILGFFSDADPEDAYSASDTIAEKLKNIELRLKFIMDHDLDERQRRARLLRAREDLREVHRKVSQATRELYGPDADLDGRLLDILEDLT